MAKGEGMSLTRMTGKPRRFQVGVFDIEGDNGERGFVHGVVVVDGDEYHFSKAEDMVEFFTRRKYRSYRFYAYNLTYDYALLMPYMPSSTEVWMLGGKILFVKVGDGRKKHTLFADALNLFAGQSLAKLGRSIGMEKWPTPPALLPEKKEVPLWRCEKHGIEFCVECYCARDAWILYRALQVLQDCLDEIGGDLGLTLASTAMRLYRRRYLSQPYRRPDREVNDFCRQAYYGGRVEAYVLGEWEEVNYYDVHSLYPYVMHKYEYPDPNYISRLIDAGSRSLIWSYEGVSEVLVNVPYMHIPPLPYRHKEKLYFPYGRMRGVWTHAELRFAAERGCTIEEVYRTVVSFRRCRPFADYVSDLYARRKVASEAGSPFQLVYKILMNSLYGKFAQRNNGDLGTLYLASEVDDERIIVGSRPLELFGDLYLLSPRVSDEEPCFTIVLWSAYIAAYARMELYRWMERASFELLYVDTDSLVTPRRMMSGEELGQLKCEGEGLTVRLFAPKWYTLVYPDGSVRRKAKGVPAGSQEDLERLRKATYLKPLTVKEAAMRDLNPAQWVEVVKEMKGGDPKRVYIPSLDEDEGRWVSRPFAVESLP
jgi:hypothetical protein